MNELIYKNTIKHYLFTDLEEYQVDTLLDQIEIYYSQSILDRS